MPQYYNQNEMPDWLGQAQALLARFLLRSVPDDTVEYNAPTGTTSVGATGRSKAYTPARRSSPLPPRVYDLVAPFLWSSAMVVRA